MADVILTRKEASVQITAPGDPTVKFNVTGTLLSTSVGGRTGLDWSPPSAQAVWLIPHNLNCYPQVTVTTPDGRQIGAQAVHLDRNTLSITFSSATSGTAHLL